MIEMESGKVISKTYTKDTVNYHVKKPSETIQSKINEFVPIVTTVKLEDILGQSVFNSMVIPQ